MTHMVIFRTPDGKPGYHQADGLDEAVRFVERLRNEDGVTDCRIFHMQEVPIEFRTYYRVEIAGAEPPASGPAAAEPVPTIAEGPEPAPGREAAAPEPVLAEAAPSGRFGLFSRG